MPKLAPPTLAETLARALNSDFFVPILVSSQTKGKFKSLNLPYGLGKTSLAFWLSYMIHGGEPSEASEPNEVWDEVFADTYYYPSKLIARLAPNVARLPPMPAFIYDDVQMTAPADQNVPGVIRRFASYLSTNRPEAKVGVLTAPNMNSIAAPLRRMVAYELIVWERGHYEVQQIVYHKNFHNPIQDKIELAYVEGTEDTTVFDPLPEFVQKKYDDWRAKQKAPFQRQLTKELERYEKLVKETDVTTNPQASEAGRALAQKRWG